jgi:hypothetical protein
MPFCTFAAGCISSFASAPAPTPPGCLPRQVEALLERVDGGQPPVQAVVEALEELGYCSWAQRVVCSAGARLRCRCPMVAAPASPRLPPALRGRSCAGRASSCARPARAGFGVPNRRRRVFIVASMYGDARDVLLAQVRPWACLYYACLFITSRCDARTCSWRGRAAARLLLPPPRPASPAAPGLARPRASPVLPLPRRASACARAAAWRPRAAARRAPPAGSATRRPRTRTTAALRWTWATRGAPPAGAGGWGWGRGRGRG